MAQPEEQAPCVTIFGAGVTGLTAAHELVERGFKVQVWEPALDPRNPERGCEVGGLAKTQWGAVAWPDDVTLSRKDSIGPMETRGTHAIIRLPQKYYFGAVNNELTQVYALGAQGEGDPIKVTEELIRAILEQRTHIDHVYCEVYSQTLAQRRSRDQVQELADKVAKFLQTQADAADVARVRIELPIKKDEQYFDSLSTRLTIGEGEPIRVSIQLLDFEPEGLPEQAQIAIRFRVRERWIPGEHGFRFFPAFYSHVFDSMKRTPILGPIEKPELEFAQERSVGVNPTRARYGSSGRTVYDNLTPTTKQGVAFGPGREPAVLSRSLPLSIEEFMDWVRVVFGTVEKSPRGLEYGAMRATSRDVSQFQLRIFQYLTSSEERRKDYEQVSWLDFLCGGRPHREVFSDDFINAITSWPEALVALRADEADARTQGSVSVQLLLDNLQPKSFRDGTLNGPTNIAWLDPWRRYLEYQGVEFIHGKLDGFELVGGEKTKRVWPKVTCYEPRYPGALDRQPALMQGYFLLALPATEAWRLSRSYRRVRRQLLDVGANEDLRKMAEYPLFDRAQEVRDDEAEDRKAITEALAKRDPGGELRHMVGIQYYFAEDIQWLDGHVTYPDATSRISSISQPRFWQERHDWEHGHRGVLSVIVTRLDETWGTHEREQLAAETWAEIQGAISAGGRPLPEPLYWHVDDGFVSGGSKADGRTRNLTPVQVQKAGNWELRPGEALDPYAEEGVLSGYSAGDGIVLAGTFMKTFTRLTTMEAANESARHAVNAILQAEGKRTEPLRVNPNQVPGFSACQIFPLEAREPRDLAFLKEVDAELYRRGLEHFIDILDLGDLLAHGLSGRPRDPFNVEGLLDPLARIIRETAGRFNTEDGAKRNDAAKGAHP